MNDNCKRIRQLLDAQAMESALDNMAATVAELIPSPQNVLVLGMASRGIPLAHKLAKRLSNRFKVDIPCGSIDPTFYRDDFHYRKPLATTEMRITEMPASVEGKTVILVDDVLYTGRSARAAIQAILDMGRPAAIRYPRGAAFKGLEEYRAPIEEGKAEFLYDEGGILLLAVGSMVKTALKVREMLKEQGLACSIANARFVQPMDTDLLRKAAGEYSLIVTMEENVHSGGFGEHVAAWYAEQDLDAELLQIAIPDTFVTHGSPQELCRLTGIDEDSIVSKIMKRTGK